MNTFYREAQGARLSTLGIGTYLGPMDDATDAAYREAAVAALRGGINLIDTSLNYRHQRSEQAIGRALEDWGGARPEVWVCTKAGYLVPNALPAAPLATSDIVRGVHCLAPAFLHHQLNRSLSNLGLTSVDVFYLHNPETQWGEVSEAAFYARIGAAFRFCEQAAAEGRLRYYGVATWDGFRRGELSVSLRRLEALAREAGGDEHHFRFIQLPVNLAMTEALTRPVEPGRTVLDVAGELGITAIGSASLLQARLAQGLPEALGALLGGDTDAVRAIQFARSMPGITAVLAGMSRTAHVEENLAISRIAPLSGEQFRRLFR